MTGQDSVSSTYGVHSEVGTLRKVLVCAPGLAHRRLSPSNADELLFDDVLWVENAQRDHADFVNKLQTRGVEGAQSAAEGVGIGHRGGHRLDAARRDRPGPSKSRDRA